MRRKPFKVFIETDEEERFFAILRIAYGFRNNSALCKYLVRKETEVQGLLESEDETKDDRVGDSKDNG